MLDIRTLMLLASLEDRYQPSAAFRAAEIAVFPLLRGVSRPAAVRPAPRRAAVAGLVRAAIPAPHAC
jgi:hypothetical protein